MNETEVRRDWSTMPFAMGGSNTKGAEKSPILTFTKYCDTKTSEMYNLKVLILWHMSYILAKKL
jgi:hypothetical protein